MKYSPIVLFSAVTALAVAQPHNHVHRHKARQGSPVEGRAAAAVTETVAGPVTTVYELNGQYIPWDEVAAGIANGKYALVGETISTVVPSSTSTTPTPSPSSSSVEAAAFYQKPSSTSTTPEPTPTPTSTTKAPAPAKTSTTAAAATSAASSTGTGLNADFPSGTIDCSAFPSAYGPVAVDWLGHGGWSGVQNTPSFNFGVDAAISYIETAVSGSGCTAGSFCSYACPAGYQKSQWPSAQGNTGQSIGGLYCNSNGKLELSRPSVSQLCTAGVGNVQVTNKLSSNVAICRTDYPGTEGETIPLNTEPGQTYEVTCPDANDYYVWEGSFTSAQYYINPSGASVSDACQWGSAGSNLGNWAPVNMGVGKGSTGETFISLFPNSPTNPDGKLDFNIKITGGVSGSCSYSGGMYYSNGVASSTGCTVSHKPMPQNDRLANDVTGVRHRHGRL